VNVSFGSESDERGHHLGGLLLGVKQTQSARKRTWGSNVGCWGISGRTGDMAGESVHSHERKFLDIAYAMDSGEILH